MLALLCLALANFGCASKSKVPTAVPSEPAKERAVVALPGPSVSEKRLQLRIETLQEEVRGLSTRVDGSERAYWGAMPPTWQDKVRAAKAEASRPSERIRYLEALEAVLARKLRSLQDELRTYEAYQKSDPLVPKK
jgi:hypothetical protein